VPRCAQLLLSLERFAQDSAHTRVEIFETVLGGTSEAIEHRKVDLAIKPVIPAGFAGEPLLHLRFIRVAHPDHPLHKLGRKLSVKDLRKRRNLVVRDYAARRSAKSPTVDVAQRWTFSNMSTAIYAASLGHGFAWYPEERIRAELARGLLKPLPLRDGGERWADTYLVFVERDAAGPRAMRLAKIIRDQVERTCGALNLRSPGPSLSHSHPLSTPLK
jgi:DNA-binding transcriptional LysR family regulator